MAGKTAKKTDTKTEKKSFLLTKPNGKVIKRDSMSDVKKKRLKAKGWKVEEA